MAVYRRRYLDEDRVANIAKQTYMPSPERMGELVNQGIRVRPEADPADWAGSGVPTRGANESRYLSPEAESFRNSAAFRAQYLAGTPSLQHQANLRSPMGAPGSATERGDKARGMRSWPRLSKEERIHKIDAEGLAAKAGQGLDVARERTLRSNYKADKGLDEATVGAAADRYGYDTEADADKFAATTKAMANVMVGQLGYLGDVVKASAEMQVALTNLKAGNFEEAEKVRGVAIKGGLEVQSAVLQELLKPQIVGTNDDGTSKWGQMDPVEAFRIAGFSPMEQQEQQEQQEQPAEGGDTMEEASGLSEAFTLDQLKSLKARAEETGDPRAKALEMAMVLERKKQSEATRGQ